MGFIAEISAWVEPAFAGWRYLFSSAYREQLHEGWQHEKGYYVALDVILGFLGVVASVVVVFAAVALLAGGL